MTASVESFNEEDKETVDAYFLARDLVKKRAVKVKGLIKFFEGYLGLIRTSSTI